MHKMGRVKGTGDKSIHATPFKISSRFWYNNTEWYKLQLWNF
jgi:hypothetical protein